MPTCTRCGQNFGPEVGTYCPACGAPLTAGQADPAWTTRIGGGAAAGLPSWPLAFIWIALAPIAALLFPILVIVRRAWIARHVRARLASLVLSSPRFTQTPEGQAILARYRRGAGGAMTILASLLALAAMLFSAAVLFIAPVQAPRPIRYEDAIEALVEGRSARRYVFFSSPQEYEQWWKTTNTYRFSTVLVLGWEERTLPFTEATKRYPNLGLWDKPPIDTAMRHRPYYYYTTDRDGFSGNIRVNRASEIVVYWNGIETASILFYCGIAAWYVTLLWAGLSFWIGLLRHASAEALAAGYATGDTLYHDRLNSANVSLKTVWGILGTFAAVTQLQLVFFPLMSALGLLHHAAWERDNGVAVLLETGSWSGPGAWR